MAMKWRGRPHETQAMHAPGVQALGFGCGEALCVIAAPACAIPGSPGVGRVQYHCQAGVLKHSTMLTDEVVQACAIGRVPKNAAGTLLYCRKVEHDKMAAERETARRRATQYLPSMRRAEERRKHRQAQAAAAQAKPAQGGAPAGRQRFSAEEKMMRQTTARRWPRYSHVYRPSDRHFAGFPRVCALSIRASATLCGWIERIPGGTRKNDGQETGIMGACGREISVDTAPKVPDLLAIKPFASRFC